MALLISLESPGAGISEVEVDCVAVSVVPLVSLEWETGLVDDDNLTSSSSPGGEHGLSLMTCLPLSLDN